MKRIILLFYFFRVCLSIQPVTESGEDISYLSEIKEDDEVEIINGGEILSASLFKTVKKYYCRVGNEEEQDFLVYGTKSWTFPAQDVTLNLEYPSRNRKYDPNGDFEYILTELQVILHLDGASSKGYITRGGMLQNHISMTFVFSNITSLSYQFYLYGVPKNFVNLTDNYTALFSLC